MTLLIPGYAHWPESDLAHKQTALAMGIFDGVHLGHQALLQKLRLCAEQEPLTTVALTFDPHPAKVLSPAYAPPLLEPIAARVAHMQRLGVDAVVVHPFTKETAQITAEDFVRDVLHGIFHVRHIVVGADFVFGHKQGGNVPLLTAMGRSLGFEVHGVPPVRIEGMVASSTKIREFVHRECTVIPVILPGCADDPDIPILLKGMVPVDFRTLDPDPYKWLIFGITGRRDVP